MAPRLILNPNKLLRNIKSENTEEILKRLKDLYEKNKLIGFDMIGIARNELLGVFKLVTTEYGFDCYRICIDHNKLIISDIGYPVTNIGNPDTMLTCDMDYLMKPSMLTLV